LAEVLPPSLAAWLTFLLPMMGALATPLLARVGGRVRDWFAVAVALISATLATSMLPLALEGFSRAYSFPWIPVLGINAGVLVDPLSVLMATVVGWVSLLIFIYSVSYMEGDPGLTRYWFLMLFFIGSMQLIVLADNLLLLFFGWEGVGLCSYALIGYWYRDEEERYVGRLGHVALGVPQAYSPTHAGMKAFLMTRVGDLGFLAGIFLIYASAGTFEFTALARDTGWASALERHGLLIPTALLIFLGAVGKSAQFPLHEWLPDAMAGPTSVSALIHAATMVKAGVYLVARVAPIFYTASRAVGGVDAFFQTVAWIGAFTAFLAASQALVSKELKKILAFSTVSQIGYMMLALGVAGLSLSFVDGFTAGFLHLTSHAIFKASMFMVAGAVIHVTHTRFIDEMGGLSRSMRISYLAMLLAGASLAGIPPFSGFWSKDAILASVLGADRLPLKPAVYLLASATALATAFYTFRMMGLVFHGVGAGQAAGGHAHPREPSPLQWVPYTLLALASLGAGILAPLALEPALVEAFSKHLAGLGIEVVGHGAALNPLALATSLTMALAGTGLAWYFYVARRAEPGRFLRGPLAGLYTFLENRWYINSLYYRVFVYPVAAAYAWSYGAVERGFFHRLNDGVAGFMVVFSRLGNWFDLHVVDGVVNGVAWVSSLFSLQVRRLHTGLLQQYVVAFVVGVLFVLLLLLMLFGGA
jgi:NADH-quinone oxidoreductase subunit L